MLTVAPPDAIELRSNATFEALMWALARPGQWRDLPGDGFADIAITLVDRECVVFADDPGLGERIAATGAVLTRDIGEADHVFLASLDGAEERLERLRCGSALYPDDGATLIVSMPDGTGAGLRLRGPGIDGASEAMLGISPGFWALRARLCAYPEGFDMFVVDGSAVIGIPRSTQVEVI